MRALFDEWQRRDLASRKDGGAEIRRAFEKDVLPKVGHSPVAEVSRRQVLAIGEWRSHDLRRSGATPMGESGVRSDVIERALNHVETKGVARIYQRQELMDERQQAFAVLGERLALLASGRKANDVVGRFAKVA